jgi:hypothetical protein
MTARLLPAAYTGVFVLSLAATLGAGLGWGGGTAQRPANHSGPALVVLPTLSTQEAFFGDQVTARVEVIVDGTRIHDSSVNVRATFAPYSVAAGATARESLGGGYLRRIYTYRLHCLQAACLPRAGGRRDFRFHPVAVSVAGRPAQSAPWPHLLVVSRLHANAGLRLASLRRPAVAPQGAGRLSPLLLWGGGGAALLGIALVAAWGATRARAPGRPVVATAVAAPATDPVADACARVRAIVADGSWARRQGALDLLARRLAAGGADGLAVEARSLAWRRTRPSEADVAALLDRVERRDSDAAEADEGVVAA